MKKALVAILAVQLLLVSGVFAQMMMDSERPHRMMCDKPKPKMLEEPSEELGLTSEQKKQFEKIRLDFIKNSAELKAQLEVKKAELRQLWLDETPNKDAIIKKAKEINDIKGQLEIKRIEMRYEQWKILTPDQRSKFNEMRLRRKPPMIEHE